MIDIVTHFSKIIDYLEQVTSYSSKLNDGLEEMIKEQRENVKELKFVLKEFGEYLKELEKYESLESDKSRNKIMNIHIYTTELEWYISEINDLNGYIMKIDLPHNE